MKDQIVKCFLCDGDHGTEPCPTIKAGVKCECGSTNTVWISGGLDTKKLMHHGACRWSKPTAKSHVTIAGGPGGTNET